MGFKEVTVRVRVESAEAKRWRSAARRERRSLSDWMRLRLSGVARTPLKPGPSAIDQRRLLDGAYALAVSSRTPATIGEVREHLMIVCEGIAALQSLDDLGARANARAEKDLKMLSARYQTLKALSERLEGEEA